MGVAGPAVSGQEICLVAFEIGDDYGTFQPIIMELYPTRFPSEAEGIVSLLSTTRFGDDEAHNAA